MNKNKVPFLIKDIGTRINEVSAILGGKKELAKVAGLSESQLHRIVSGESQPRLEPIAAMARAANVSLTWLATGEGPMRLGDETKEKSREMNEFALIPGYNVEVAAGAGASPVDEQPSRRLAFRHKWLRYKGLNEKDLVLVFARGDSMEPTISDNNTLMIDTSQQELSDGAIYVIRVNSHLVVKRVQTLLNRDIMLISDNTAYHPETLKPEQLSDLRVIGKVVWVGKDL